MNIHERMSNWQENDGVKLFRDMNLPSDAIVVDFGCGYGEYTIALALSLKNEGKVYAIDKDNKALKILKNKVDEYKCYWQVLLEKFRQTIFLNYYQFAGTDYYRQWSPFTWSLRSHVPVG